jgi:hypothetical protein
MSTEKISQPPEGVNGDQGGNAASEPSVSSDPAPSAISPPETRVTPAPAVAARPAPAPRKSWIMEVGSKLLHGMEAVGEMVAGVLGLDDAKYQYVWDSMTEEEKAEAKRINDQRNAGPFNFSELVSD